MINEFCTLKAILTISRNLKTVKNEMIPHLTHTMGLSNIKVFIFDECKTSIVNSHFSKTNQKATFKNIRKICSSDCDDTCKSLLNNHKFIINYAKEKGYKNVLIFEDDARFIKNVSEKKIKRIVNWLNTHEWDIFFLGAIVFPVPLLKPITRDIGKCKTPLEAHAYMLSVNGMEKILKCKQVNHFDYIVHDCLDKKYICIPSICNQNKTPAIFKDFAKTYHISSTPAFYNRIKFSNNVFSITVYLIFIVLLIYVVIKMVGYRRVVHLSASSSS